ncbi:MAG TPA: T9SS type A sorting domain-containing protein [Ignavibacteria bacterium]
MKFLRLFILLTFIQIFFSSSEVFSLDTNVFKYFPLKVGNRWTWFGFAYPFAPPPNTSQTILSTKLINNHLYYFSKHDVLWGNGTIQSTYSYCRIDSLTGNFYSYDTVSQTECLADSLNSRKNDSARTCGGKWYRCIDTAFYNIFNQNIKSKTFYWTNYFEGGDDHKLALGIGKVHSMQYGAGFSSGYSLRGCLINGVLYGDTSLVGINQISSEVPETFSLSQNYPNPFNPTTNIGFRIADFGLVKLVIYDVLGREIQTLVNEELKPGTYEVEFPARQSLGAGGDGSNLPSGVYYYTLSAGDFVQTKKMVLIK